MRKNWVFKYHCTHETVFYDRRGKSVYRIFYYFWQFLIMTVGLIFICFGMMVEEPGGINYDCQSAGPPGASK